MYVYVYLIHSVDVVPVIESTQSAQLPTFTSIITPPTAHRNHNSHHHSKHREGRHGTNSKRRRNLTKVDNSGLPRQNKAMLKHSRSHDNLHTSNMDSAGFGSNTESREDLLDTRKKNNHNRHTMREKSNSGSKVAELINSYEETAKLSQSSSDSVSSLKTEKRGNVESGDRARVGRVMSMVTEHAYCKPQTLVLRQVNTHIIYMHIHSIYHSKCICKNIFLYTHQSGLHMYMCTTG